MKKDNHEPEFDSIDSLQAEPSGENVSPQEMPHRKAAPGSHKSGSHKTASGSHKPGSHKTASGSHKPNSHKTASGSHKPNSHKTTSGSHRPDSRKKSHNAAARRKKEMISLYAHLAILAVIVLIGIVGVVKLVKWNRGRDSGYDPNEINTEFDTESEDYFVPPDPSATALQADDGVTSILLLGNGALAKEKGKDESIGKRLQELSGGQVYDASLDRTYLSVKNAVYQEDYPADVFSLYWMASCIASGDYTLLRDTARTWDGDDTVQETVDMLENLDMSTIDVITIMYDYHDYEDERILAGPYDETLAATCCGCLLQSIRLLQQAYPQARIIVSSPYFAYIEDENGQLQPGGTYDMGQGTLADYMIAYKNIAVNANVSFIDNYFGTITADNYAEYLKEDKEHLDAAGCDAIARRIVSFIGS